MSVPACENRSACEGASSEAEVNPRARRNLLEGDVSPQARQNLLEGAVSPRARQNLLEGGVNPQARRNLFEGAFGWAIPVGRGGHSSVGCAPCVRFRWEVFRFGFLQVLSRIPMVFLGDPHGCPDTKDPTQEDGKL
jgi:hypothetical protein